MASHKAFPARNRRAAPCWLHGQAGIVCWEGFEAARGMIEAQPIQFHPLCGGIHPDLAWQSLRLFAKEVRPVLHEEGLC